MTFIPYDAKFMRILAENLCNNENAIRLPFKIEAFFVCVNDSSLFCSNIAKILFSRCTYSIQVIFEYYCDIRNKFAIEFDTCGSRCQQSPSNLFTNNWIYSNLNSDMLPMERNNNYLMKCGKNNEYSTCFCFHILEIIISTSKGHWEFLLDEKFTVFDGCIDILLEQRS